MRRDGKPKQTADAVKKRNQLMNTPLVDNDLASIRQELNELRAEMTALRKNGNHNGLDVLTDPALTDRRGMMKKMAGLAVGVAAVGLLRPSSSKAARPTSHRAPHTTGDNFVLGDTNDADAQSNLINSTTDLIPVNFVAANYGDVFFVQPDKTSMAVVGYASTDGASAGTTNDLFGVYGQAIGGNSATGGFFVGDTAAIGTGIGGGAVADPNETDPAGGTAGDLYRGSTNGSLWYRADSKAGSYRRVADSTTAGAFSLLDVQQRLVDTRTGSGFFDAGNHYSNGTVRTYNVPTISDGSVPDKARGIVGRITVVNATKAGILNESSVNPPGGISTVLNFAAAQTIGGTFTSGLSASGEISVKAILAAAGTVDVIIDIVGYYY